MCVYVCTYYKFSDSKVSFVHSHKHMKILGVAKVGEKKSDMRKG